MPPPLRILLVDDHPIVRFGLNLAIEGMEGFEVCGEAEDILSARTAAGALKPDIIILDLSLGGRDGLELIAELIALHRPVRILVFSALPEASYGRRVLQAGAFGYLSKEKGVDLVPAALQALVKGKHYVSPELQETFFQDYISGTPAMSEDPLHSMTDRELQVLRLVAKGRALGEIAEELHLSVKTVGTHRDRIKGKLGVENAKELFRRADEYLRTGRI